jgi:hypothetical protein
MLMARIGAGRNWKSRSTPRGKSQEYNFNPQKSSNQHKVRDDGLEKYPLLRKARFTQQFIQILRGIAPSIHRLTTQCVNTV